MWHLDPPIWISALKLILSKDIEKNPGDFRNTFLSCCIWNLNSLVKDNFKRVRLLEAHNSIYDYDLIFLCESSLNSTVEIPDDLLENYSFVSSNSPYDTRLVL